LQYRRCTAGTCSIERYTGREGNTKAHKRSEWPPSKSEWAVAGILESLTGTFRRLTWDKGAGELG